MRDAISIRTWLLFALFSIAIGACAGLPANILTYPPYGDSVLGVQRESLWLRDHGWNYFQLAAAEPGYSAGGPRTYFFSLYILLTSILYALLPAAAVHCLLHVLTWSAAVSVTVIFFALLRTHGGSTLTCAIATLALAICPLFLSQAISLNMEMLIALSAMLSCRAFVAGSPKRACLWTLGGVLLKPSGAIACVPTAFLYLLHYRGERLPRRLLGAVMLLAPLFIFVTWYMLEARVFFRGGADGWFDFSAVTKPRQLMASVLFLEPSSKPRFAIPDLHFVHVAASTCLLCRLIAGLRRTRSAREAPSGLGLLFDWCALLAAANFAAFEFYHNALPRYLVPSLPAALAALAIAFDRVLRPRFAQLVFGLLALLFYGNLQGRWYAELGLFAKLQDGQPVSLTNSAAIVERSLAMIDSIHRDQVLAKVVSSMPDDVCKLTTWPYHLMLTVPEMGYVDRPLHRVYSVFRANYAKDAVAKCRTEPSSLYIPVTGDFSFIPMEHPLTVTAIPADGLPVIRVLREGKESLPPS